MKHLFAKISTGLNFLKLTPLWSKAIFEEGQNIILWKACKIYLGYFIFFDIIGYGLVKDRMMSQGQNGLNSCLAMKMISATVNRNWTRSNISNSWATMKSSSVDCMPEWSWNLSIGRVYREAVVLLLEEKSVEFCVVTGFRSFRPQRHFIDCINERRFLFHIRFIIRDSIDSRK